MIDAHVHVWRIGANGCTWPTAALPALHRDFALADYRAASAADGVILVQSQEDTVDTDWLLSLAAHDPLVLGVIGWCDLTAPDAPAHIARLAADPKLCGLRPMVQDRASDWYDDPALDAGLAAMADAGLVLEALVRPRHLPALARLAARHPMLRIVVNHGAKPDLAALDAWRDAIGELAANPRTCCKLSGLLTELRPGQDRAVIATAAAHLHDLFGPGRLLWGSDWPVLHLASTHDEWHSLARAIVPAAHHQAVFHDTAAHLYGGTA